MEWLSGTHPINPTLNCHFDKPLGVINIPSRLLPLLIDRQLSGSPCPIAVYPGGDNANPSLCYKIADEDGDYSWAYGDLFDSPDDLGDLLRDMSSPPRPASTCPPTRPPPVCPQTKQPVPCRDTCDGLNCDGKCMCSSACPTPAPATPGPRSTWIWIIVGIVVCGLIAYFLLRKKGKLFSFFRKSKGAESTAPAAVPNTAGAEGVAGLDYDNSGSVNNGAAAGMDSQYSAGDYQGSSPPDPSGGSGS